MNKGKEVITAKGAPPALGPYSQAIRANGLVFLAGQTPLVGDTGKLIEGDIKAQTRQALDNLKAVLTAAGLDFSDVLKTTVFLLDMGDFTAMNEVYAQYFPAPYPARSTVQVARLPKDARVEIELVALAK